MVFSVLSVASFEGEEHPETGLRATSFDYPASSYHATHANHPGNADINCAIMAWARCVKNAPVPS